MPRNAAAKALKSARVRYRRRERRGESQRLQLDMQGRLFHDLDMSAVSRPWPAGNCGVKKNHPDFFHALWCAGRRLAMSLA